MPLELRKYKEHFKELPEEEFSLLEKALESGLRITKRSLEGAGCKFLERKTTKKFTQKLPTIYSKFEALEKAEELVEKKEELLEEAGRGQGRRRGLGHYYANNPKITIPWAVTEIGLDFCVIIACAMQGWGLPEASPAWLCWYLGACGVMGLTLFNGQNMGQMLRELHHGEQERYAGLSARCAAGFAWLIDRNSNMTEKVRSAKLGVAKKEQRKLETKLRKSIEKVFYSNLPYTRKWLKQEKKELLKMLGERDHAFPASFLEVENNLLSYDKIGLYKTVERYLSNNYIKNMGKNLISYKFLVDKLALAEKAGVQIGELKEKIQRDLKSKAKGFDKLAERCLQ